MTTGGAPKFKEFRLTSFAVDHPTLVLVLTGIVVLLGLVSYVTVPKESSPEIVVPNIFVHTIYPGVAPKDIETLISRPIEEELNTIGDVKHVTSISTEGVSSINVEFEAGVDMDAALAKVREKVDIAKPDLPEAAEDPQIIEINFAEFPIMQVNVSGPYSLVRLREVAEVVEAIQRENVTVPGGSIDVGEMKYLVRVPGQFETTTPIAGIVVDTKNGRPVYVRDVATVDFGFKDRDSYARLDGEPVVSLAVKKRSGENIIETADAVRATIARLAPSFPPGTVVKITSDQSQDIQKMVSSLENNIISGLILVVAVLLFFLGVRTAWFVGLAIPTSMLLSFIVLKGIGFSMNMVVLFSLILALGMLVDNAIVVVENIYRFREQGYDRRQAAKYATGEVALPIISSTATTLAAFLPMVFWPGIVGEFMKYLPYTLIITLSSSLFVALVIVPSLCGMFLSVEHSPRVPLKPAARVILIGGAAVTLVLLLAVNWLTAVLLVATVAGIYTFHHFVAGPLGRWFMHRGLPAIIEMYERQLRWALSHRGLVLGGAFGALALAVVAFGMLSAGVEFFPEDIPPATVYVQVDAPLGTRVEQTDAIVHRIENELRTVPGHEDFESVVATVGSQVSNSFSSGSGTHLATVAVNFVDYEQRRQDAFRTVDEMRRTIGTGIAGADISVELPDNGPPTGAPVTLEISGANADTLRLLADEAVRRLERAPVFAKLDGLESDMDAGRPELVVDVDREKAGLYGLNTGKVGRTVRAAINGVEASKFRDGKDEYDITVRLAKTDRENLSALEDLTLVPEDGGQVPLSSVATVRVLQRQCRPGRGAADAGAVRGRPAAGLPDALRRPAGGPGTGPAVPVGGVRHRAAPDRVHPSVAVRLGHQAADHHDVGDPVHHRGADGADRVPHAVRHHHDRRGRDQPGGRGGEQRHRADRLHRPPAGARRPHAARGGGTGGEDPVPAGDPHRGHHGAGAGPAGDRAQHRLPRVLLLAPPRHLLGRRAGGVVGPDGGGGDRGPVVRHRAHPGGGAVHLLAARRPRPRAGDAPGEQAAADGRVPGAGRAGSVGRKHIACSVQPLACRVQGAGCSGIPGSSVPCTRTLHAPPLANRAGCVVHSLDDTPRQG
jgi:multidrug efflux pump